MQKASVMKLLRSMIYASVAFAIACASSSPAAKTADNAPTSQAASGKLAPSAAPAAEPAPGAEPNAQPGSPRVAWCDVVCEVALVEPESPLDGNEDLTRATEDATRVLDGMKPDLAACSAGRIRAKPQTQAFMRLSILVAEDGKVQEVETEGGAPLGERAVQCIVERVKRASFEPPRGHGTMRVQVPFTLQKAEKGEQ